MYPRQLALFSEHLHPAITVWLELEATMSDGCWKPLENWTPKEAVQDRNLVVLREMVKRNTMHEQRMGSYLRLPLMKKRRFS